MRFLLCLFLSCFVFLDGVQAAPGRPKAFQVPAGLRDRVDFWIDIFTKYGKHDSVIHHRNYPQITFDVVRFRQQGKESDRAYAKYRKNLLKEREKAVENALKHLAAGKAPRNALEKRVSQNMQRLGSGTRKYKEVLKDDLIRSQTGIREKYRRAVERSGRYLPIMEKIFVKDYGLPVELTRLPFIESSFDYTAYSSVGAAGIWQFIRSTGRSYMTINRQVDERRDPVEATHAAAKYLQFAYKRLGNWPLAVTSYNHGVAGVARKIKKLGTKDIVRIVENPKERLFGFASANFYPELLAAVEIYDNPRTYFPGVQIEPPLRLAQRELTRPLSVGHVQRELDVSVEELKKVNYGISSRVWSGYYSIPRGYKLKVPREYSHKLARLSMKDSVMAASSVYGGNAYKVRRGDTLSRIARTHRTTVSELQRLNNLSSDLVRVGQILYVKQIQETKSSTEPRTKVTSSQAVYRVQPGDTLSEIARQFGTSVSALRQINGLSSSIIRVGQKLKVGGVTGAVAGVTQTYKVRPGDSLYAIARRHGVSVEKLRRVNGLKGSLIRPGQVLRITPGGAPKKRPQYYKIRRGDSLYRIAKRFGTTVRHLKDVNRLRSNNIRAGETLRIPG